MDEREAVRAIETAIRQPGIVHAELRLRRDDVEHVDVMAVVGRDGARTVELHLMAAVSDRVMDDLALDHWRGVTPDGGGIIRWVAPDVHPETPRVMAEVARRALERLEPLDHPPIPAPLSVRVVSLFDDAGWAQIGCFVAVIGAIVGVGVAAIVRLVLSQPLDGGRAVPLVIAGSLAAILFPPVLVAIASRLPILRRWLEWIAVGWLFVGAPVAIVIIDQVWRVLTR